MHSNNKKSGHAWVLGGSVAGLLAARVLSDHYERVFIIDREKDLGDQAPRKGAPQGRHVHAFLPRGVAALESMFPGIFKEIIDAGASNGDLCGDAQWCPGGNKLRRKESELRVIAATRPFTESFITKRVTQISNIEFVKDTIGVGFRAENGKITGVKLRDRSGAERTEDADLFVDAAGRASQLPQWLKDNDYAAPREEQIIVKLHYATVRFKHSTATPNGLKAVIIGAAPGVPRGGFAQWVEHDVLQASMAAYA
ncbi:MAG: FAD-dependent oxidoreductase, partial [Planctomycetaceae bacterium]